MRITDKRLCGIGGFLALMLFCVGGQFDPVNVTEEVKTCFDISKVMAGEKEEGDLVIPQKVKGLSFYEPLYSYGKEISEQKAQNILSTVSKGRTGDLLEFDAVMNPYYNMLSETEKAVYRQIYANAEICNKRFSLVTEADEAQTDRAFFAVYADHPKLFWLENQYKYLYSPSGKVAEMTLQYNIAADNLETARADFDKAVSEIKKSTYGLYTDYEKERQIHDKLIGDTIFDANAPMNDSAYGALVNKRAASAGYARAYQHILSEMGIPCYFVEGFTNGNHAWNIVELGDGYYNVDTCWDDTDKASYDYFNKSDEIFSDSHLRRGLSQKLPKCDASEYTDKEDKKPANNSNSTSSTNGSNSNNNSNNNSNSSTSGQNTNSQTANNNSSNNNSSSATTTYTTDRTTSSVTTNSQTITVVTVFNNGDAGYIDNLRAYYNKCFDNMMQSGKKSMSFDVIINGEELWNDIYKEYQNGGCAQGFTERYLAEKHLNSCQVSVTGTPRSDGSYLVSHSITCN